MTKKGFSDFESQALRKLDEIVKLLNIIVELNIPSPDTEDLKLGSTERAVLNLCDLRHTTQEISSELKKTPSHVRKTLTGLRKKGLLKSVSIDGKTYYIRVKR